MARQARATFEAALSMAREQACVEFPEGAVVRWFVGTPSAADPLPVHRHGTVLKHPEDILNTGVFRCRERGSGRTYEVDFEWLEPDVFDAVET